jgi:hypothetical protein
MKRKKSALEAIAAKEIAERTAMCEIESEADAEVAGMKKIWDLDDEVDVALAKYRLMLVRAKQAGRDILANGLTVSDAYGRQRVNPAVVIEKDAVAACMRIIKQLGLSFYEEEEPAKKSNRYDRR